MYVIPTFHPAFILRKNRRYVGVVQHDMQRAVDYARGVKPKWNDDGFIIFPKLAVIKAALRKMRGKRIAFDIETDGRHPLTCDIRCIGLYDGEVGICIPLLYRDGTVQEIIKPGRKRATKVRVWKSFYGPDTEKVLDELRALFADTSTTFYGQNAQFDCLCLRSRLRVNAHYDLDTMLAHHTVLSYLPHSLAFLTSVYTDRPYYKTTEEGDAWSSTNDEELSIYCIRDCVCTYAAAEFLKEEIKERAEDYRIYQHDHRYALECEHWKEIGFEIDTVALEGLRKRYSAAAEKALAQMHAVIGEHAADALKAEIVGDLEEELKAEKAGDERTFRPGQLIKLRKVLQHLGVPLLHRTETGAISTAAEFLLDARRELIDFGVSPEDPRLAFLDYLFAWRESTKILSTFLQPEILPDGRLHCTFSVSVTPTGRLSAKGPNIQNQPKVVRCMFVARKGHKLVCGDWDSLELRLTGYITGDKNLLQAFIDYDAGKGPKFHKLNCHRIFGVALDSDFDSEEIAPLYRAGKAVVYGTNYGAGEMTAFEAARKDMPDLTIESFRPIYAAFKRTYPRLFEWQKAWISLGMKQHYHESPVLKRRAYFWEVQDSWYGGEDSPEAAAMLNFPMQSGASDVVGLANFRVMDEVVIPMRKKLRKGEVIEQLAQIHDELIFEVPERLAQELADGFKRVAERPPDEEHLHWHLPVDIKIKDRWGELH